MNLNEQIELIKRKIEPYLKKPLFLADETEATKEALKKQIETLYPGIEVKFIKAKNGKLTAHCVGKNNK